LNVYTESDDLEIEDWADRVFIDLSLIERLRSDDGKESKVFYFDSTTEKDMLGLSTEVFGYALLSCWESNAPHSNSFDLKTLLWADGSPNSVFKLTENQFIEYIEKLMELTEGAIEHRASTNLNQLYRTKPIEALDLLKF